MLDYPVAATDSLVASEQSETVVFQRRLRLVAVSPMLTMALSSQAYQGGLFQLDFESFDEQPV